MKIIGYEIDETIDGTFFVYLIKKDGGWFMPKVRTRLGICTSKGEGEDLIKDHVNRHSGYMIRSRHGYGHSGRPIIGSWI